MSGPAKGQNESFSVFIPDSDEKVIVTVQQGSRVRRIECDFGVAYGSTRDPEDPDVVSTWSAAAGKLELVGRSLTTAIVIGARVGELEDALAVALAKDHRIVASAIGGALLKHATWRDRYGWQVEEGAEGVRGAGDAPGEHAGGEESSRAGGEGSGEQPQDAPEEDGE